MFYFLAGLIIGGYLVYCGFMRVRCSTLVGICPFAVIVPGVAALILFLKGEELIASLVLIFGVALSSIMLFAIRKLLSLRAENERIEAGKNSNPA